MPRNNELNKILLIGSGPIVIGQGCEFDYSGVQACKALREEGYEVVLVNSNPATIMTDPEFADRTYIEPITAEVIEAIIEREKPDAILPTLGGQTALNAAMELNRNGALAGDQPHQFKLDGYYNFNLSNNDGIVLGTSFRAASGQPRYFLGVNQIYAPSYIIYLIPQSEAGRNDVVTNWDLQLSYVRQLPRKMQLQFFFAVYNLLNSSTAIARDDRYTANTTYVTPIVNGTVSDLRHLKGVDGSVATPNVGYGQPTAYQAPLFTRFGLRLSF